MSRNTVKISTFCQSIDDTSEAMSNLQEVNKLLDKLLIFCADGYANDCTYDCTYKKERAYLSPLSLNIRYNVGLATPN